MTCSDIDALPSFPEASTISSSSGFVVEGVFRQSVGIHSLKMVHSILFVFGSYFDPPISEVVLVCLWVFYFPMEGY